MFEADPLTALLRAVNACGLAKTDISRKMGREQSYIATIFAKSAIPRTSTYSEILDACGFDLIVRRRDDGSEIRVTPQ